ncbi:MAG TPA: ABC transporter ATP-binding protein [Vicinamibacterales bacterium]|jgi:NitT/TauT family transport system ATP-binding protein
MADATSRRDERPALALRNIVKRFGARGALEDVTLDVAAGRFVSIVGPSGSGKSTLLNIAAGILPASAGRIEIFGAPLEGINRRASYMFQQDVLLPWKTVLGNVLLGPTLRRHDPIEARESARRWLDRVGLTGLGNEYPYQLSGGMRKRVALAQCWIVDPDMILMDEPFSALDVHTRLRMEEEILDLWTDSGKTVVFVTHDLEEAISLSDEVFVLSAGPGSRVVGRYTVDLPRPRGLLDIRTEPRFHEMYRSIWNDLRREVVKTYERTG